MRYSQVVIPTVLPRGADYGDQQSNRPSAPTCRGFFLPLSWRPSFRSWRPASP
jgi:hypothetical protein